jgi:hypothetical protein
VGGDGEQPGGDLSLGVTGDAGGKQPDHYLGQEQASSITRGEDACRSFLHRRVASYSPVQNSTAKHSEFGGESSLSATE